MSWSVDHLVVAARRLDEGVMWCEAVLGVTPGPGGQHAFMGTHNRLAAIGSARFPRAYLEIIAIDAGAPPPARVRWFDLDQPALQAALASGPALVHWVASCDAIQTGLAALRSHGLDAGVALSAERASPRGMLRWQISQRPDGRRLAAGALPALIEWAGMHPADAMPPSGLVLEQLVLGGWPAGLQASLPAGVAVASAADAAPLAATLSTPRGRIVLESLRLST